MYFKQPILYLHTLKLLKKQNRNFRRSTMTSQKFKKEKPKNNPRDPPHSARNDVKGYRYASSLSMTLLLAKANANPSFPELSATKSISFDLTYLVN